MARKKNSSAADLFDVFALMPWWVGSALALALHLALHHVATLEILVTRASGQVGTMVTRSLWRALALVGQYVLQLLCLACAVVPAYGRHQRKALLVTVTNSPAADILGGISWQEFELPVGEAFRLKGYVVQEHVGSASVRGVDLVLRRNIEKFVVQCKQWTAFSFGVGVVRGTLWCHGGERAAGLLS